MKRPEQKQFRTRISALEADVAYFDARLALLTGPPSSCYQDAQIRAYRELITILSEMLSRLQELQSGSGGEGAVRAAESIEVSVMESGAGE